MFENGLLQEVAEVDSTMALRPIKPGFWKGLICYICPFGFYNPNKV